MLNCSEMKTCKQIADEIGVKKINVYRYVTKYHSNDIHRINDMIYIDMELEKKIIERFKKNTKKNVLDDDTKEVYHEVHQDIHSDISDDMVLETLREQLKQKDEQILNLQRLLENQQKLTLKSLPNHNDLTSEKPVYRHLFFGLYLKKKD